MILTLPVRTQITEFDCGTAAINSVCAFFGKKELAGVGLANEIQGLDPGTVESLLRKAGLGVLSGSMLLPDLRTFTKSGRPVLCPVSMRGGHWVVVAGVERRRVYLMDPACGALAVTWPAWDAMWEDTSRAGQKYDKWGIVVSAG